MQLGIFSKAAIVEILMSDNTAIVLAGDIGGTNARFVLFVDGKYSPETFRAIPVAHYLSLIHI